MELKLILLLLSAILLAEQRIERNPASGAAIYRNAARTVVRLCGEDLKRAVTYNCGASRWKRYLEDTLKKSPGEGSPVQADGNKDLENTKLQSAADPELEKPSNDRPSDKEPLWTDFYNGYEKQIPVADDNADWKSTDLENLQSLSDPELKQPQHDHPQDTEPSWTDFFELYNGDNDDAPEAAENDGQKHTDPKGLGNLIASDDPQTKTPRKRDLQLKLAVKCCSEGCTAAEMYSVFC